MIRLYENFKEDYKMSFQVHIPQSKKYKIFISLKAPLSFTDHTHGAPCHTSSQ